MTKKLGQPPISRPKKKGISQSSSSVTQRSTAAASIEQPANFILIKRMEEGAQLESVGRHQEAESLYKQLMQEHPDFAPAYHALGLMAFHFGQNQLALQLIGQATILAPKEMMYHRNLGEISRRAGIHDQAILSGQNACSLSPKDLDAHYNLGLAYTDSGDYQNAIRIYRKALKLNPKHGLSWNNLGSALEQLGDKNGAFDAYAKAVQLDVGHAEAQNNLGAIYSERGKIDQARASFEAAIGGRPNFVEAHYNLSTIKTYSPDDAHLTMLESLLEQQESLTTQARIRYNFALGKALDDIGQYDRAFSAYELGNHLQHSILPTDEIKADALLADIERVFSEEFFRKRSAWQGVSDSPIFIVGMPRSGTSLLEQILSSHPQVYGAGELSDLTEVVSEVTQASYNQAFPQRVTTLTQSDIERIGTEYCQRIWGLSPQSAYIVDKMPANFFYLGLIYLAMPNAKIIHAMRDPMDSCFSCYSRLFNDTMEFAYDQRTLGRYYARYMQLMQHWRKVLPRDFILDLPYEDLVADVEGQAKRILEFVGLPWDPSCLEFYKNDRLVKTASVMQVRKPIYKSSVARWRHFARYLRPLYDLVKEFRDSPEPDTLFDEVERLPILDASSVGTGHEVKLLKIAVERTIELQGKGDHFGVLRFLDERSSLVSRSPVLLHLRGISLYRLDRFDDSLRDYQDALALQPVFPAALNSLGFLLQDIGRVEEAKASFEKAINISPEFSMARLNLGLAQLKLGEWESGWENYEARWTGSAEIANPNFGKPALPLSHWDGQLGTENQSLLVVTEQGFGDTFQFARFLRMTAQRFKRVGFICSEPTRRLMEWAFGDNVILMTRIPDSLEVWDWYCPLMSLPRAFKTRVDSIPEAQPYFPVPKAAQQYWGDRLNYDAPKRFKVGIAWSGRKSHQYDARRSIPFEKLLPLLSHSYISWVSLQKWGMEEGRPFIPSGVDWIDWTSELGDFADTAALIKNLDLVISIDSSMVHLAGNLGVPVWMLNRFDGEWRWLGARDDSPWYPTLKIFNQTSFGNWDDVLDNIKKQLHSLPIPQTPAKERVAQYLSAPAQVITQKTDGQSAILSPTQALQLASQLHSAGRAVESREILEGLLKGEPKNAHALHLLGLVFYQMQRIADGLQLIDQAIEVAPDVAFFYSNKTEMLRQQGRFVEAVAAGHRAIEIDPMLASSHSNLGVALYDLKEYEAAKLHHERALSLDPALLQSLNNLGSIARAQKNRVDAVDCYERALKINPNYVESISNLGAVLVESDRAQEAYLILEKGLALAPQSAELLCNLGLASFKTEKLDYAMALLQRSLELKPGYPEALTGLAAVLNELDRLVESEGLLLQALKLDPLKVDAYCQLGALYTEQGKPQEAKNAFDKVLSLDPESTEALVGLGNLCLEAGNLDDAENFLRKAIAIDPENIDARFHLTQIRKSSKGDENGVALEATFSKGDELTDNKKISLHYALGKVFDDQKEYEKAFSHFAKGAQLKRKKLSYDPNRDDLITSSIIQTFDKSQFDRLKGQGDESRVPIFVLGMPRSGTTLTEQIIASHPQVFGAGELNDLGDILYHPKGEMNFAYYPEYLADISPASLNSWGHAYIDRLKQHSPTARHITDKMPSNYMLMGLIPLVLPNAKIIHVKRNPVDTCISCFTRLFNRHQDATYDLSELGRHYANYSALMEHWRSILPAGSFYEIEYERLVENIEGEARGLVNYCGLEWEPACLSFYKNKRSIRTASVSQVRQPLYKTSVARWRHYEDYLAPLLEELNKIPGVQL